MCVSAVLLAAGASTRFGSPKMLAPVPPEGRPMLAHVIDTWRGAGFAEIVVVLGHGAANLQARTEETLLRAEESERNVGMREGRPDTGNGDGEGAARPGARRPPPPPAPVRWIINPDWESGMFSSVATGLAAVSPSSTHAAVSPADLPFLSRSSLRTVLGALSLPEASGPRTLVVPVCGRRRGHPLVIPALLARRVLSWPPDSRLSRLFSEPDVKSIHLGGFDETILRDVDEPGDLRPEAAQPFSSHAL